MTFLNGILAFGAAAFSIPLLIHLLNRSRFRTVSWGAMHLLESLVRTNQRRLRMEQLILLLIRCAIPILLALCLARPVVTAWHALPGDAASSVVLLLDDSYSMDTVDAEDRKQTRFDRAVAAGCDIIQALPNGSDIAAMTTGGGPMRVLESPVFDAGTLVAQLRLLHGGYDASRFIDSLQAAIRSLETMSSARRELIVLSDFQRSDWESIDPAALRTVTETLAAHPIKPHITLLPIGREIDDNLSVDAISVSRRTLGVNQECQIRARIKNHGVKPHDAATVFLVVDGVRREANQIALGAKAANQVLFTCQFKTAGSHLVDVQLAVDDALPTDNHRLVSIRVWDRIPVLLVDGAPSARPLEGETDFLAVALTPFTLGRVQLADLLETRTIAPPALSAELLTDARVVVLANVAKLADGQVDALLRYVQGGGSLLMFLGNQIDLDWYNRVLGPTHAGLLPMSIDSLRDSTGQDQSRATRIISQSFEDPALAIFNDRTNGNLADAEIRKWYRLAPTPAAGQGGESSKTTPDAGDGHGFVMARFETSDPFLVRGRVGSGLVVISATACDADWSNLPMRPVYVPLVQQLITTLASQVLPPTNIHVGEPLLAVFPGTEDINVLAMTMPDGVRRTTHATAREAGCMVEFHETRQPGVYTLSGPTVSALRIVARTGRTDSRPELLDAEKVDAIGAQLGATVVRSADEYLQRDKDRRYGREIWKPLLASVLGLMFLELFLQQRFAKVGT